MTSYNHLNKIKISLPIIIVCSLFFFYTYQVVHTFPLYADDFVFAGQINTSISLHDWLNRLLNVMLSWIPFRNSSWINSGWNNRFTDNIYQLLIPLNTIYIDLLTSLMSIVFIIVTFFYIFCRLPSLTNLYQATKDAGYLLLIFVLFFYAQPYILTSIAWRAGAWSGHFIGNTFLLILLIPFYKLLYNYNQFKNIKNSSFILWCIGSFLIIKTTETMAFLALIFMTMCIYIYYIRNKKVYLWSLVGLLFSLVGYTVEIINSFKRITNLNTLHNFTNISHLLYINFLKFIHKGNIRLHNYEMPFRIIFIILVVWLIVYSYWFIKNSKLHTYPYLLKKSFLFLLSLILIDKFHHFLSPYSPARSLILISFLSVCTVTIFIQYISTQYFKKHKYILYIFICFVLLMSGSKFLKIYSVSKSYNQYTINMENHLIYQASRFAKIHSLVIMPKYVISNKNIMPHQNKYYDWEMSVIQQYLGIKQIIIN